MVDIITIGIFSFIVFIIQLFVYLIIVRQLNSLLGPLVSKAFGILGKQSGKVRGDQAATDDLLEGILTSPKVEGIKMIAGFAGIDVDEYLGKHGPEGALKGVLGLGELFGLSPVDMLGMLMSGDGGSPQGLFTTGGGSSKSDNPYLRRGS